MAKCLTGGPISVAVIAWVYIIIMMIVIVVIDNETDLLKFPDVGPPSQYAYIGYPFVKMFTKPGIILLIAYLSTHSAAYFSGKFLGDRMFSND